MIVHITGKLVQAGVDRAVIEHDGIGYELYVPAFVTPELVDRVGGEVTFYTIQYYEGQAVGANLYPRLIGFLNPVDRQFFLEFIKVKGLGHRKALRALAKPPAWIAQAIEEGDAKLLATLPELGKKTAELLVSTLAGKLQRFAETTGAARREGELGQAQREALEILLQLGERRADAVELIRRAAGETKLTDPAKIVEAVYKLKSGAIG